MAKKGNNTRILDIRGRGVPFRSTSIKLYYKDINPEYNNLINNITDNFIDKAPILNNATLNDDELRRNLLCKRGCPKKFD